MGIMPKEKVNIEDVIFEIKKWSRATRTFVEDNQIEYFYVDGRFYKEDNSLEEVELTEAQLFEELTAYKEASKSIYINNQMCVFNLNE